TIVSPLLFSASPAELSVAGNESTPPGRFGVEPNARPPYTTSAFDEVTVSPETKRWRTPTPSDTVHPVRSIPSGDRLTSSTYSSSVAILSGGQAVARFSGL